MTRALVDKLEGVWRGRVMMRLMSRSLLVFVLFGTTLPAQRAPIAQQLTFAPYHANGIYEVGETVGWTVTPGNCSENFRRTWNRLHGKTVSRSETPAERLT
jgi:hypothetical protein